MPVSRFSGQEPTLEEHYPSISREASTTSGSEWRFRAALRWRRRLVLVLTALFLIPGLVGHAPWKQDETYTLGLILHILHSHDWVVPTLTGRPFMEKPPLYDLVAAAFVQVFSPWLQVHNAARLASGFFTLITFTAVWIAALGWGLRRKAPVALLALMGCLGLAMPAHTLFTDVALLSGFSLAYAGFAWASRRPWPAGILIGTGVGVGFLSKGLLAPGIVGLVALLLPTLFPFWRSRTYGYSLFIAFLAALPWLSIWPLALYQRSPALFMQWFWQNNVGRFLGFSVSRLGASNDPVFWWKTLPWFTFPALFMAAYGLRRRSWDDRCAPMIQCAGSAVLVTTTVLALAASARTNYALPLLPPLVLLAVSYRHPPGRHWRVRFWWAGIAFWGLLGAALWLIWGAMRINHHVPSWMPAWLPSNYRPDPRCVLWAPAAALTLLWVTLVVRYRRHPRPLLGWVAGLVMVWGLLSTVMLPWINTGKTYRPVFTALARSLPAHHGCVANIDLGESERAMLQYYAGLITRAGAPAVHRCPLLIVEKHSHFKKEPAIGTGWHRLWSGHRDGDPSERFWLYARSSPRGGGQPPARSG